MHEIFEIRYAAQADFEELRKLYAKLKSCNGNPSDEKVQEAITASRDSIYGNLSDWTRLTLLTNELGSPNKLAATASLIRLGDHTHRMYVETLEGLELKEISLSSNMAEFGAMVVSKEYEGIGLNHLLTRARALILRLFSGILNVDHILSEFLPPYNRNGTNAFWHMIAAKIKSENPGSWESLLEEAQEKAKSTKRFDSLSLFKFLISTTSNIRDELIEKYFPQKIEWQEISRAARKVTKDVGPETQGARRALSAAYMDNFVHLSGYFSADGGRNYEGDVRYGALGERTVEVEFTRNEQEEATVLQHPEQFIVWESAPNTPDSLARMRMFRTPAIRGGNVIKLPRVLMEELKVRPGGHIRAYQLPYKPRTQTP